MRWGAYQYSKSYSNTSFVTLAQSRTDLTMAASGPYRVNRSGCSGRHAAIRGKPTDRCTCTSILIAFVSGYLARSSGRVYESGTRSSVNFTLFAVGAMVVCRLGWVGCRKRVVIGLLPRTGTQAALMMVERVRKRCVLRSR